MKEISSRPALEHLRSERRTPAPSRALTPGGHTQSNVHSLLDAQREKRISHMERRLSGIEGHITREFAISKERGRAASDFEHSR